MYPRAFNPSERSSYFLFGPRGVGKSTWLRNYSDGVNYIDLLDDRVFLDLSANPTNLLNYVQNPRALVVIDEVQKIPKLLDEVHRLIENKKIKFVLSGSSARKLRGKGVNLLGGRAQTELMHPLLFSELGVDFKLSKALDVGFLPLAQASADPKNFFAGYINTYLKEEVIAEGLTRNLSAFSRFLQAASFSQASVLNISNVASDCAIERKTVQNYFTILRDLLISFELPIFSRKSKRELIKKNKFYFFDCGVFSHLRPRGPLDDSSSIRGPSFETLMVQQIRALNDYNKWGYELQYWHTRDHLEVDLVLYGERGLVAIEFKSSTKLRPGDFKGLIEFKSDYPKAKAIMVCPTVESRNYSGVLVTSPTEFLESLMSQTKSLL